MRYLRWLRAALGVAGQTLGFAVGSRRWSLVLVVVGGLLIAVLALVAQFVVPAALYPFV